MSEVQPEDGPPQVEIPPETPERQSTPFLVLQFFIFPMAIVAVCVAVFVIFGLIAAEGKTAREYVQEVRTGGANRRWQAAFELSKLIQARKDKGLQDPKFVSELVQLFDDAAKDDPRVRRYLALALGRLGDKQAVPALLRALKETGPDGDPETLVYSIFALGSIRDEAAVPELVRLSSVEDAGIRKAAIHALGAMPGKEADTRVREALQDGAEDVRWNAALALAHRGNTAAAPVVLEMMDRAHLAKVPGLLPDQAEAAIFEAVAAAAFLDTPATRDALATLRDKDQNLRVRQAASEALQSKRGAPPSP